MKAHRIVLLVLAALMLHCAACQNQKKTTRKVTIEGPEKKTEVKLETTEKERDDDRR